MEMKNEGALLSIKRIYYRGKLNSCNYTCSYCPFGKKSHLTATTQDEHAWNRFITAIEQWQGGRCSYLLFITVKPDTSLLSERDHPFSSVATSSWNFLSD